MTNICLESKLTVKCGRDLRTSRMATTRHLGFVITGFGPSTTSPLMDCAFPADGIIIRYDVSEILGFYDFSDLFGNSQYAIVLHDILHSAYCMGRT